MSFSSKSKALALIPKFTGFLSFAGSTVIFQDILRDRQKRSRVYHRLVLGLSAFDIMASVVNVLSTWPIPEGSPGVYLASGTTQTCTAQGFFNETGNMTTPMYNAALCLYYILIIREGWSEKRLKKVEPYLHAFPLLIGWTMGVLGLPFDLYNNSGWLCWIAPYPSKCHVDPLVPCERGRLASLFRWIHYGLIWSAIVFVTVGMSMIYNTVRQKEKASMRYTSAGHRRSVHMGMGVGNGSGHGGGGGGGAAVVPKRSVRRASFFTPAGDHPPNDPEREQAQRAQEAQQEANRNSHSRKVALQAMLFVSALYTTWIFTTLTRIFQIVQGKTYFPLLVLMATFFPLQGFFNALIYLRPRLLRTRQRHPELNWWRVFLLVIRARGESRADTDFSASTRTSRVSLVDKARKRLSSIIPRRSSLGRRSSCGSSQGSFNIGRGILDESESNANGSKAGGEDKTAKTDPADPSNGSFDADERDDPDGVAALSSLAAAPPGGQRTPLKSSFVKANGGGSGSKPQGSVQWAADIVAKELAADLDNDLDLSTLSNVCDDDDSSSGSDDGDDENNVAGGVEDNFDDNVGGPGGPTVGEGRNGSGSHDAAEKAANGVGGSEQ